LGNILGILDSHWISISSAQNVIGQMANSSQTNANMFRNICCDLLAIDDPFPEGFLKSPKLCSGDIFFVSLRREYLTFQLSQNHARTQFLSTIPEQSRCSYHFYSV
jgi:hypothetical protein